jgi:putative transposase
MSELNARGVEDILIALVDGLTGFPDAIHAVFPQTQIHHCVVHLVRQSLGYVPYRDRKQVLALKAIYRAPTEAVALEALRTFEESAWSARYPTVAPLWRRHWEYLRPVFAYPPAIRRLLYTTNAIERLHMQLRKLTKTRGSFPTDEAATKLLYLGIRNIVAKWRRARLHWTTALTYFAQLFGDRFIPEA